MRAQRITITKKAIAEALGVSERSMYTPYITSFLTGFEEFNQELTAGHSDGRIANLQNEITALKMKVRELQMKNRELKVDLSKTKIKLKDSEEQYERLLGKYYQENAADKIVYF